MSSRMCEPSDGRSWRPASAGPYVRRRLKAALVAVMTAALVTAGTRSIQSHETLTTTVLFDREIVRVLDRHCVMCHAEKSLAFPLETYEETWVRGRKIRAEVIARHMPPWAAFPGYGDFANDNSLTLRESQFVVSWVEGLGPRNSGKVFLNVQDTGAARPQAIRARPAFDRWQLGQPDFIRQLPATVVESRQPDHVKRIVVDLGLTADRRVRALEFMPGDRRVVRAAFFTVQETGQWLGSWTPWYGFTKLPDGVASRLPAGSHVIAELHYRGTVDRVEERGTIGLFFDSTSTVSPGSDLVLLAASDGETVRTDRATIDTLRAATRLTAPTLVTAVWPAVDEGIRSIEVAATRVDGRKDILLYAKDLPVAWPTPYIFRTPKLLAAGTQVSVTAHRAARPGGSPGGPIRVIVSRYASTVSTKSKSRR